MTIELGKTDKQYLLSFPVEMTIYSMESLRSDVISLLESFDNKKERMVNLDFGGTQEMDWTGVQLIMSFVKSLHQRGFENIRLIATGSVLEMFELLRVEDVLAIKLGR